MSRPSGPVDSTFDVVLFARIVRQAFDKVSKDLASSDLETAARREKLQKELLKEMEGYKGDMEAWKDITLPRFYIEGVKNVLSSSTRENLIFHTSDKFTKLHKRSVQNILAEAQDDIDLIAQNGNKMVKRGLNQAARQEIFDQVATGKLVGTTNENLKQEIKRIIKEQNLKKVTLSGKNWKPDHYADMLARTMLSKAQRDGVANQMTANGHDLVIVSEHANESDLCRPWEGRVLSLNGMYPQYPRLETAISSGLYHPNCRHTITPHFPEFARKSKVWDADKQKYVPWEEKQPRTLTAAEKMGANEKEQAFTKLTEDLGGKDLDAIREAMKLSDKKSLNYYASKPENKHLKGKIERIKQYL